LIVNSAPVNFRDFGGRTHIRNELVEYNTFINGTGIYVKPTTAYGPLGEVVFRRNLIRDNQTNNQERALVTISPYGSDADYLGFVGAGLLSVNENCYYVQGTGPGWSLYAASNTGALGSYYTSLSSWKSTGFDTSSVYLDPALDRYYRSGSASCSGYGWLAGES
jgi:hypothetical protein